MRSWKRGRLMAKDGTLQIKILGDSKPLEKTLNGLGGKLAKFGAMGAAAGGAAIAGLGVLSVRTFANFDQAMTSSIAIMGDVSAEMRGNMSEAARDVAKTTVFSAEQAAQSYFFLASAGLDAAESIEALPKVAAFAQAGNFDMALATDLLTDAQSALGLTSDDSAESLENLARVGDVLVKANTLANASVEQFSEALTEKAGAALNQLNKDVEEGAAVLAVYADQGVKGSAAGSQLNAVLEGLTRTARLNADAYSSLGVEVFDAQGEMRNMGDIVADLEGALEGMSTEAALAELAQLGLTRTARDGVVQLLGNADAIKEYEKSLREAGGTVDEVADKQLQTFWAQLGLVKDNLLDVALSIGQALMPALMEFVDWLQANLPAVTGWFQDVADKFNDLLGVSEDTMGGTVASMDEMSAGADRALLATAGTLDGMYDPFSRFEDTADRVMFNAAGSVHEWRVDTEGEFGTAETFMSRLGNAWSVIWDEDIKPWFMNTMLPWLENTFFPNLISAFGRAGAGAATAFASNLLPSIGRLLRDGLSDIKGGFDDGTLGLRDVRVRVGDPPPRITNPSRPGGGGAFRLHEGGVVPGRPGQEVDVRAMAGETFLPTHKPAGQQMLGDTFTVTQNFYGTDPRMAQDSAMSLRMMAIAGAY